MRLAIAALAALVVALAPAATAGAGSNETFRADVESVATVVSQVATVFEFNLYNCPAGQPMELVFWEATQPDRPGSLALFGPQPYGPSSGDRVQHLTVSVPADFLAGERWVGSGAVACGPEVVPVEGAGTTMSLNGV